MDKLWAKVKEELRALLPPTIFFLLALSIISAVHTLMLRGTGIPASTQLQVLIGALVLGKAVLISDMLPVINRYPDKPLAYNIAWKTVIYFLVAAVIHYLERLFEAWKAAGSVVAANARLRAEIIWPHFWAIQIILLVLIFNYCVMHELVRVLGARQVHKMFFGERLAARS
jgi:hypothetical protein